MLTRRRFTQLAALASASAALPLVDAFAAQPPTPADITVEIAPFTVEPTPKHRYRTLAYNGQVPGPILRLRENRPVTVEIRNGSTVPDLVHWHGLFLPPAIDGATEEGTPLIAPGASTRFTLNPRPGGFRWFHTHTFAGKDLRAAQYGGEHGFLWIDPQDPAAAPPPADQEFFLALHDWGGYEEGSDDGSEMPVYDVATVNGKALGYGEPLRVKPGSRVLFHILNSSPTEVHWIALPGHTFRVVALDGNPVPTPGTVPMLRVAPAERVCALVEMNSPGVWVLGEVQPEVRAKGMGVVVEYAGATGTPVWRQPGPLDWSYAAFAANTPSANTASAQPESTEPATSIPLTFESKFEGHGAEETWRINGRSFPQTETPLLQTGKRYRLVMKNLSTDEHPIHMHRHIFEVKRIGSGPELHGLRKDVVLIPARSTTEVEFTADNPGDTLFHCHQQNHMDRGFMLLFRYA